MCPYGLMELLDNDSAFFRLQKKSVGDMNYECCGKELATFNFPLRKQRGKKAQSINSHRI